MTRGWLVDGSTGESLDEDDFAGMPVAELQDRLRLLVKQQQWLEHRWQETNDATVVVHLLQLWVEGTTIADELRRR